MPRLRHHGERLTSSRGQGCILQTKFPTKVQAQKYLLTNWPIIERMARDALATGTFEDGQIKLVMI
jgi:hypothetical protein